MSKTGRCKVCCSVTGTLALLVLAASMGCHRKVERPAVKTYPVTGKVVSSRGKLPPAGTLIQFQPDDAELVASGLLEADGSFSLTTLYFEKKLPGAAEGSYHVTLLQSIDHRPGPQIELKQTCRIGPQENQLTIDFDDVVPR
jgi:hypothetical protein